MTIQLDLEVSGGVAPDLHVSHSLDERGHRLLAQAPVENVSRSPGHAVCVGTSGIRVYPDTGGRSVGVH